MSQKTYGYDLRKFTGKIDPNLNKAAVRVGTAVLQGPSFLHVASSAFVYHVDHALLTQIMA